MEVLASSSSSVTKSNQLSDVVSEVVEEKPNGQISGTPGLKEFSFADLKTATSDFKPEALIDEGGYGRVYKGWIDKKTLAPTKTGTGMAVAIKILNPEIFQAFEQWQLEMNILGRRYHPNLIELLGYCWENEKLVLVLEFMQKGSLQHWLFRESMESLPWDIRLKIAIGAARGLAFLHTCEGKVIYRSFNSSNILLDKMQGQYNRAAAFGAAQLAVKCLMTKPTHRPSMKEVLVVLEQIEEMDEKPRNSESSSLVVMEQIEEMEKKPNSKLSFPVSTAHCHGQPRIHHRLLTSFKVPSRYLTSKMSCMRMCCNKTKPHVLT